MSELKRGNIPHCAIELGQTYRKQIESGASVRASIRFISRQVGHGVFAEEPLAQGQYVGEYTGIVRENVKVYFAPLNPFCYEYPIPDRLGRSFVIDATAGNFTRFINHSYTPNLKPCYAFLDGFYHLIFFCLRKIQKGEQLLYDYGRNYWILRSNPKKL